MKDWQTGIDKTYVINLPHRLDRRQYISQHFAEHDVDFELWPATSDKNGATGLKKTFQSIFDCALKNGWERVLVFEDDAQFIHPPAWSESRLGEVFLELPKDFLTLQLGINLLIPPNRYSSHLLRVRAGYAAHAVVYSNEAMLRLLPLLDKDELAFDQLLAKHIQPYGNSYCTFPMLVTQHPSVSDIAEYEHYEKNPQAQPYLDKENKMILWGEMMKERYDMFTKFI